MCVSGFVCVLNRRASLALFGYRLCFRLIFLVLNDIDHFLDIHFGRFIRVVIPFWNRVGINVEIMYPVSDVENTPSEYERGV